MRQKRNDDVVREKVSTLGCGFFPENVHGFLQDFHGSFSGLRCELLSRHPLSPALHCELWSGDRRCRIKRQWFLFRLPNKEREREFFGERASSLWSFHVYATFLVQLAVIDLFIYLFTPFFFFLFFDLLNRC